MYTLTRQHDCCAENEGHNQNIQRKHQHRCKIALHNCIASQPAEARAYTTVSDFEIAEVRVVVPSIRDSTITQNSDSTVYIVRSEGGSPAYIVLFSFRPLKPSRSSNLVLGSGRGRACTERSPESHTHTMSFIPCSQLLWSNIVAVQLPKLKVDFERHKGCCEKSLHKMTCRPHLVSNRGLQCAVREVQTKFMERAPVLCQPCRGVQHVWANKRRSLRPLHGTDASAKRSAIAAAYDAILST